MRRSADRHLDPVRDAIRVHALLQRFRPHRRQRPFLAADGFPVAAALLRVLQPGRVMAVHVKDRIVPGGMTGLGFQTVYPFHSDAIAHYQRHGFAFLGMKTIVTDVVRENNQTYRSAGRSNARTGRAWARACRNTFCCSASRRRIASNGYADQSGQKKKPLCDDHGEPAPFDSAVTGNGRFPAPAIPAAAGSSTRTASPGHRRPTLDLPKNCEPAARENLQALARALASPRRLRFRRTRRRR
jgi:hypothetical protein